MKKGQKKRWTVVFKTGPYGEARRFVCRAPNSIAAIFRALKVENEKGSTCPMNEVTLVSQETSEDF
jgi:hypothetical protein